MKKELRVLVVEDEEIESRALVMMLRYNRADLSEIRTAENGISAVDVYREFRPDVVLIDINLPGINGLEAIRQMQRIDGGTHFVIISAYNLFSYAQEALRLNVTDYLVKPVRLEDINRILTGISEQIVRKEQNDLQSSTQQEKLAAIRPLLESDCIYAIASMRAASSIPAFFDIFQIRAASACLFILKTEPCNYALLTELRQRFRVMGQHCIGDIINGLCICVLIGAQMLKRRQVLEILHYLSEAYEAAGKRVYIGVGSICAPDESLRQSYVQAMSAVRYAAGQERAVVVYDEVQGDKQAQHQRLRTLAAEAAQNVKQGNIQQLGENVEEFFAVAQLWLDHRGILTQACWFYASVCGAAPAAETPLLTAEQIMACHDIPALCEQMRQNLVELAEENIPRTDARANGAAEAVVQIVHRQYMQDISLPAIAGQLNFSFYYLSKLFKKHTGVPFSEYLTCYRLDRAKELLSEGRLSMKEIAYATGFHSQGYFSKIFRKYTGISPSEYKERQPPGKP